MEFRDYLKQYRKIHLKYLEIKDEANASLRELKKAIEDCRDYCGDNLIKFNKENDNYNILIKGVYEYAFKRFKELDKEWNTLSAIIVPTQSLYEEVATYLSYSLNKPYRPELHTYTENDQIKMYYTINVGDKELFKSDTQVITKEHKIHETTLFDIDNFYPLEKNIKALRIMLYGDDYKSTFAYRLDKMSKEDQEECILNAKLFNIKKNDYIKNNLKDITFEELNEFLISIAENYSFELSDKYLGDE
ncbi:MAG: hypothetical protein J5779_02495 [Clostridia bacterium]|nr:hypothetical protein [Clostridia bacterium]